jgi:hypothetical protein
MWSSGYVVVPTSTGCCISVTLQVDPKVRGRHCRKHWHSTAQCSTLQHASTQCRSAWQRVAARGVDKLALCTVVMQQSGASHGPLSAMLVLLQGWIPTSVINWSLEAIPLNIQHVRAAVARLGADVLESLADSCRHHEAGSKAVPRHFLGNLPPEWSCAPSTAAAAGYGVDGNCSGPAGSACGVQESVGGWGAEWAAASGQPGSSASLASSSARSCGSEWSCGDECEHDESGGGWFDAVE